MNLCVSQFLERGQNPYEGRLQLPGGRDANLAISGNDAPQVGLGMHVELLSELLDVHQTHAQASRKSTEGAPRPYADKVLPREPLD